MHQNWLAKRLYRHSKSVQTAVVPAITDPVVIAWCAPDMADRPPRHVHPAMTVKASTSYDGAVIPWKVMAGAATIRYSVKQPSPAWNKKICTISLLHALLNSKFPYFTFPIANYQTKPWYMFTPYPEWRLNAQVNLPVETWSCAFLFS